MRVQDQFAHAEFTHVVDDRAGVHITSRDGRFHLGWFPNGRPGGADEDWVEDEGWMTA